jgi:hypothetical protein
MTLKRAKNKKNDDFLKKKFEKVLPVQKKCVPLQPQNKRMAP